MAAKKESIDLVLFKTRSVLSEVAGKVVGNDANICAAKRQAGKKRHHYTTIFKTEVINMMEQLGNNQESAIELFRIDQSQASSYLKNKIETMKDAADDYHKKIV